MRLFFAVISLLIVATSAHSQPCTFPGHTPSSAVLLCGSDSYTQSSIPLCGQTTLPVPCNGSFVNMNPTWFELRCFAAGTLGFMITPHDPDDNFDWQLFDVTGRNNDDVFTDASLFVACNWSPVAGETGASANGNNTTVCSDAGQDPISKMPNLILGHQYLLLVSHRTSLPSGFSIALGGGSASVTDPQIPELFNARLNCNGNQFFVLLNKKMICASMASDGSDFTTDAPASIISVNPGNCNPDGESNLLTLTLSNAVPPGNYTLQVRQGSDLNSIRDRCGREIAVGSSVPVLQQGTESALPDSIRLRECASDRIRITFRKPIQCNSIATNGSDFLIMGAQTIAVTQATFNCSNNPSSITTQEIELTLAEPITAGGLFNVVLANGTDGSALTDECGTLLPAGSQIPFLSKPSVSAAFTYNIHTSCKQDTVNFRTDFPAGISSWKWFSGNSQFSDQPNPVRVFPSTGEQDVQLIVSNGTCSDTVLQTLPLNNLVKADFEVPAMICPQDTVHVVNKSNDNASVWQWNFGNNAVSTLSSPPAFTFPLTYRETVYQVRLLATNADGSCRDSVTKKITVLSGCYIAVPSAFTPNGDGLNDYLYPNNALKAEALVFRVFNRSGQLVFESRDWTRKWDGSVKGKQQATGVYVWTLGFTHRDTHEKVFMKGTTVLIR